MAIQQETKVFFKGRMEQDLDPRNVEAGTYIRLVNGRISRTEGGAVGALQNTLGNEAVSSFVDAEGVVLGSIRDMGTNTIYYFIKGSEEDAIYEYAEATSIARPLLRDNVGILNFNVDNLITGVNIIGEGTGRLLLWTDGFNPPRKVNISRTFTRLSGGLNGFTEQEISVEKNPPLYPPVVTAVRIDDIADADEREELEKEENLKDKFVRFSYRWRYEDNEYSVFSPFSQASFIPGAFEFDLDTGAVTGMENQIKALDISFNTGPREVTEIDLLYKEDGNPIVYVVESFNKSDREWNNGVVLGEIVENLFTGNGVSTFSLPDKLRSTNPIIDVNRGIVGNMNATTYTTVVGTSGAADTITIPSALTENESLVVRYYNNAENIRFSSNKLYRALPSDQLPRVFDNVPIRAKTQEIIQNRIVYGNYVDRYNLEDVLKTYVMQGGDRVLSSTRTEEIVVDLTARLSEPITEDNRITGDIGERSLKSDRNYEVGIVYLDNLGRQTPVLTSENNTVSIPIDRANKINRLSVDINSKAPEWATAYRFFIKQNRAQHFNIIPLEAQLQPDDNRFVWFRLSSGDQEKVKEGDYLNIKITNAMFAYLSNDNKLQVRVEEVGPQGRNFLEVTPPRVGEVVSDSGELLNPGEIYTAQESGIWMKVKNLSTLNQDFTDTAARRAESIARSNNSRGTNFEPIKDIGADYKDETYYYQGGNIGTTEDVDSDSVTFTGTYASGGTANTFTGTAQTGPTDGGEGPMRIQVEISSAGMFRYSWWLSPSHDAPAVVRQTNLREFPIGTTVLVNGISVAFAGAATDYSVGDRWVTTYRVSSNFMWRAYETDGDDNSNRYVGPNDTSRRGRNARRAHAMFTGAGIFDEGINGRSRIQLGAEDGLGRSTTGDPIALPFHRNEIMTEDTFYETFEEMLFEEGLWSSSSDPTITGTDREGGGFGIHQMGFWRGLPTTATETRTLDDLILAYFTFVVRSPIAILINIFATPGLEDQNAWRLQSGTAAEIMTGMNGSPLPLHGFIQSGVVNGQDNTNHKKNDIRMTTQVNFTQGQGVNAEELNSLNLVLETVPEETVSDIYYETGQTFPCLNGIHFGNEMSNSQRVMQDIAFDEAGNETQEVTSVPIDLDYFNCFSWRNGVESCVIRDEFLGNRLDPGAKASQVVDEYIQRENFSNLIFSAPFEQTTATNGLNEFSSFATATGAIVKEMDEQDGSIQHLFSKDTDLFTFQEDKVSKVLADKNALFSADGATNLVSARPILGQIVPSAGEFGISRDPESFAVYGNRMYFSDRSRGAILRYGGDGLTEISNSGIRDLAREELAETYNTTRKALAIGSYDDYHDQYILSLRAPLENPGLFNFNKPLQISRQAFLSRTDACRFPVEDLQFIEVYEFYTADEPAGFQVGDVIYTDEARGFIFQGDNDWFVWNDTENDVDLTSTSVTTDNVQSFVYVDNHLNTPLVGQTVTISSRGTNPTDYTGNVVSYNRNGDGATSTVSIRFSSTQNTGDEQIGVSYEIGIAYKFVINIDNFGVVRAKLDCTNITPPNHDAIRVSISSYSTPEEACGKGLVARVVYHNGDDATPDLGDSIYDTPYASDEYVAGCYMKGRTQKQGWYQMFDGDDLEDYVIRILQGKVVDKRRCAEVMANRSRILTSENPVQRAVGERDDRLATRVCAMLPTMERWFNGQNELPVIGDTIFENNFTRSVAPAGYYAITDGYYVNVTEQGVVSFIGRCSETICVDDVVGNSILSVQNQESNSWTFLGVNGITQRLPEVSSTPAVFSIETNAVTLAAERTLSFNGVVDDLGEFNRVNYLWYYLPGTTEPSVNTLVTRGIEVSAVGNTVSRAGTVAPLTTIVNEAFTDYYHIFVAQVENTFVTSDIFVVTSLRDTNPDTGTIALTTGNLRTPVGGQALLTFTPNSANDIRDTSTLQWQIGGVNIAGATGTTLAILFDEFSYRASYTCIEIFEGYTAPATNGITFVRTFIPEATISSDFSDDFTEITLTATVTDADTDAADLTYNWIDVSAPAVSLGTGLSVVVGSAGTYEIFITDADGNVGRELEIISEGTGGDGINTAPMTTLSIPEDAEENTTLNIVVTSEDSTNPRGPFVHTLTQTTNDGTVIDHTATLGTDPIISTEVEVNLFDLPNVFVFTATDEDGAISTSTGTVLPRTSFLTGITTFGAFDSSTESREPTWTVSRVGGSGNAVFTYAFTTNSGTLSLDSASSNPLNQLSGTASFTGASVVLQPHISANAVDAGQRTITLTITPSTVDSDRTDLMLGFDGTAELSQVRGPLTQNFEAHFLVAGAGGSGTSSGGGGVRTSWGTRSGGETVAGNGIAASVEDPIVIQRFTGTYNISPGNHTAIITGLDNNGDPCNACQFPPFGGASREWQSFSGGDSSISGTGITTLTSLGGGRGHVPTINIFTGSRYSFTGIEGGSGSGARSYSDSQGNSQSHSGGAGTAGQGYRGGNTSNTRNTTSNAGGGGAGGPGGNVANANNSPLPTGAAGMGLINDITGSNYTYSEGSGSGAVANSNYGSSTQDGVVILRVPTTFRGITTGVTRTLTVGTDTVYIWENPGTYTPVTRPPVPVMTNNSANMVTVNDSVVYTCTGNDPDTSSLTYTWYENEGSSQATTGTPVRTQTTSSGSDTYTATRSTGGTLTIVCVVDDTDTSVSVSNSITWMGLSRNMSVGGDFFSGGNPSSNGGVTSFRPTWSGGGTASYSCGGTDDGLGGGAMTVCNPSSGTSGTTVSWIGDSGGGSYVTAFFRVSIGAEGQYASGSARADRTF